MAIAGSVSVWWGINMLSEELERAFLAYETRRPDMLAAVANQLELQQKLREAYPLVKTGAEPLELEAAAALSLYVKEDNRTKTLFEKNSQAPLPIASITKLMTTLVALKQYEPEHRITIPQEIFETPGEAGYLKPGDVFTVRDLLYMALMESSNRAASALAEPIGMSTFVELMNTEAERLNLPHTFFVNPTGLDEFKQTNTSTAQELALLSRYIFEQHPAVFDILSQTELELTTPGGLFHHTMRNTNEFLEYYDWPTRTLGGKTGTTPRAHQTLVVLFESPDHNGYIINVLLGSDNRSQEMRQLLSWILESYQWHYGD